MEQPQCYSVTVIYGGLGCVYIGMSRHERSCIRFDLQYLFNPWRNIYNIKYLDNAHKTGMVPRSKLNGTQLLVNDIWKYLCTTQVTGMLSH